MKKIFSLFAASVIALAASAQSYYIIGAFNSWKLETAVEFKDVSGVLTAEVADLSGTFKIIHGNNWNDQFTSNGAGLVLGEDYTLKATGNGGDNIALANPFGGYKNAKLTLKIDGENRILKLASGEFALVKNDWFIPGAWQGWKCDDVAKMSAVAGKTNTYEIKVAEFSGEFKVVYGEWAVEFGAAKGSDAKWEVNKEISLAMPCDNMKPASEEKYKDVTITLVVDYEKVEAKLTIAAKTATGIENTSVEAKAIKTFENGQLVIIKNGVRYDATGAIVK